MKNIKDANCTGAQLVSVGPNIERSNFVAETILTASNPSDQRSYQFVFPVTDVNGVD